MMNEDSDTPFAFNPSENNELALIKSQCPFFNNNKKFFLLIIGGILVIIMIVVIIVLVLKGKEKEDNSNNNNQPIQNLPPISDNYFTAKFEIQNDLSEDQIYNKFSS